MSKRILLQPFWRPHAVLQAGARLPLEGFAPPHSPVRLLLIEQGPLPQAALKPPSAVQTPNRQTHLACVWSQVLQTDEKGQFNTTLLVPNRADAAYTYHLCVQLPDPWGQWPAYSALLDGEPQDEALVLRDLKIGEVWLLIGPASSAATLRQLGEWGEDQPPHGVEVRYSKPVGSPSEQSQTVYWRKWTDSLEQGPSALGRAFLEQMAQNLEASQRFSKAGSQRAQTLGWVEWLDSTVLGPTFEALEPLNPAYQHWWHPYKGMGLRGVIFQLGGAELPNWSSAQMRLKQLMSRIETHFQAPEGEALHWVFSQLRPSPMHLHVGTPPGRALLLYNQMLADLTAQAETPTTVCPVYDLDPRYRQPDGNGDPEVPLYRQVEGQRLAQLAFALLTRDLAALPPRCLSIRSQAQQLVLEWGGFSGRLQLRSAAGSGFSIGRQADRLPPRPAQVLTCQGRQVCLYHPEITQPNLCAYAFQARVEAGMLYSERGMPALPFTTDRRGRLCEWPDWMRLDEDQIWGQYSLQPGSVRSLPMRLNTRQVYNDVTQLRLKNPFAVHQVKGLSAADWVWQLTYPVIRGAEAAIPQPLWRPAGPYAHPPSPSQCGRHYWSAWVYNPDPWAKTLCLRDREVILPPQSGWQWITAAIPPSSEKDGLNRVPPQGDPVRTHPLARDWWVYRIDHVPGGGDSVKQPLQHPTLKPPIAQQGRLYFAAFDCWAHPPQPPSQNRLDRRESIKPSP